MADTVQISIEDYKRLADERLSNQLAANNDAARETDLGNQVEAERQQRLRDEAELRRRDLNEPGFFDQLGGFLTKFIQMLENFFEPQQPQQQQQQPANPPVTPPAVQPVAPGIDGLTAKVVQDLTDPDSKNDIIKLQQRLMADAGVTGYKGPADGNLTPGFIIAAEKEFTQQGTYKGPIDGTFTKDFVQAMLSDNDKQTDPQQKMNAKTVTSLNAFVSGYDAAIAFTLSHSQNLDMLAANLVQGMQTPEAANDIHRLQLHLIADPAVTNYNGPADSKFTPEFILAAEKEFTQQGIYSGPVDGKLTKEFAQAMLAYDATQTDPQEKLNPKTAAALNDFVGGYDGAVWVTQAQQQQLLQQVQQQAQPQPQLAQQVGLVQPPVTHEITDADIKSVASITNPVMSDDVLSRTAESTGATASLLNRKVIGGDGMQSDFTNHSNMFNLMHQLAPQLQARGVGFKDGKIDLTNPWVVQVFTDVVNDYAAQQHNEVAKYDAMTWNWASEKTARAEARRQENIAVAAFQELDDYQNQLKIAKDAGATLNRDLASTLSTLSKNPDGSINVNDPNNRQIIAQALSAEQAALVQSQRDINLEYDKARADRIAADPNGDMMGTSQDEALRAATRAKLLLADELKMVGQMQEQYGVPTNSNPTGMQLASADRERK